MAGKSKLPAADVIIDLLRAGHTVQKLAGQWWCVSPTSVYKKLKLSGYQPSDWKVAVIGRDEDRSISFAEAQRRKAAAEAVVAEIEASTRAGRIVVPDDRSEVTDDELDDAIEKLTAERVNRFKAAIYRQLPDALGYGFNLSKVGNTAFRLRDDHNAIDLEWDFWVLLASDILDADEKARAAVAADRAA